MCVTSCNRHDLLESHVGKFYAVVDIEPQELIVFEDSEAEQPEFLKEFIWKQRGLKWISGGKRRGQAFACARLINEATKDFVFWCEDDWFFKTESHPSYVSQGRFLNNFPEIIQVSLRGNTGWHPLAKIVGYGFLHLTGRIVGVDGLGIRVFVASQIARPFSLTYANTLAKTA
jgi:hypothetical protein